MIANIVDVDFTAKRFALDHTRAGITLLDFKAALPSISEDLLHAMLEALGVPRSARTAIRNLYSQHKCNIRFDGGVYSGFQVGAGIRQGCPISPLLFAVVVDILLRRIQRLLPGALVRAFADDIAIVVDDVFTALPLLESVFRELECLAGLVLNRPKCVLIPLWPSCKEQVSKELASSYPSWASTCVDYSGKYLGVLIGLLSTDAIWTKRYASSWTGRSNGVCSGWGSSLPRLRIGCTSYPSYLSWPSLRNHPTKFLQQRAKLTRVWSLVPRNGIRVKIVTTWTNFADSNRLSQA